MRNKFSETDKGKKQSVFAKKSFGQNFLIDQNYIDRIISALNPQKDETIIEIGAGRGALTEKLLNSGAKVLAVELEREMISVLEKEYGDFENFFLVNSDVLKIDFETLLNKPEFDSKAKLVANLPYYISTAILQKLISHRKLFSQMILMFQREVVERITAGVGNSERGFLTVLTENYFKTEKLFDVPPDAFRPVPKVWSSVVRMIPKENNEYENDDLFRALISESFLQKRKTILNNLKNVKAGFFDDFDWESILKKADIQTGRRAESLSLEEWKNLETVILEIRGNLEY